MVKKDHATATGAQNGAELGSGVPSASDDASGIWTFERLDCAVDAGFRKG